MPEEYESDPHPCSKPAGHSDFNEMAAAVAAAISVWALTTLVALLAGYHGSGPTNAINLLVVLAGATDSHQRRNCLSSAP